MNNYTFLEYLKERDPEQYDEFVGKTLDTIAKGGVAALRGLGSIFSSGAGKAKDIAKEAGGKIATAAGEAMQKGKEAFQQSMKYADIERLESIASRSNDPVFQRIMKSAIPQIKAAWEKASSSQPQPAKAPAQQQPAKAPAGAAQPTAQKGAQPAPERSGVPRANVDLSPDVRAFPGPTGQTMRKVGR